jgi:hypothetical protein
MSKVIGSDLDGTIIDLEGRWLLVPTRFARRVSIAMQNDGIPQTHEIILHARCHQVISRLLKEAKR